LTLFRRCPYVQLVFKVLDSSRATLRPEQAVVRLTSTQRGSSAYFAAGEAKSSEGLEVVFTAEGIQKQLGTQGGLFEAVLVLGAAAPLVASEWTFATIHVTHRPLPDGTQPPPPSTALERVSQPKPEIKHVFRPPVKRAPAIVSLVFTVIVLLPLFAFCLGAFKLGFVPDITSGGAYMMCYHVGLAAILAVYLLFWLRLNLVQTLPILGVLEVLTLATGMKAARSVAKRPKQE
jgi:oligosaccharyltransferase complex subunit delta (ribophorin II)